MSHISISAGSQTGLVRDHNEDILLIDTETYCDTYASREFDIDIANILVIAVADGLGGHNAGEVASEDAARELGAHIAALPAVLSSDELEANLEQWVKDEHAYLVQQGLDNPQQSGMATTLVAALFYRGRTYLINCGDSRLYLYDTNGLQQLSSDHSLYNITHNTHDSHIITNCIGAGDDTFIDFEDITERLTPGCRLLLCSDGLTDMLTNDKIAEILAKRPNANALIEAAYEAGAHDNVSVIIAQL